MKKFLMISPKNRTVYNFRGDLIKDIIKKGYEVVVTGPDRTDVDKIEALGARFIEVSMNKTGTNIISDVKYLKRLVSVIKAEKPDVTLGYTVKPVVYGAIAAKIVGVKNINSLVTGAGYTFTSTSFKAKVLGIIVRTLYKIGLKKSDRIIFQNPDDRDEFCRRKLAKSDKCFVVNGSGVNTEWFKEADYPERISFFMLSRLMKSKGVCEYLEAAKKVKEKYPQAEFFLLGKYESKMLDAVEKHYVESFVEKGIVKYYEETDDVRPYYRKCSVFVLPSSYREGTPRTVLEAMAMARPIITTDTQGCRGTVKNGINGFLVDVKNTDLLAEKMEWFIENPEKIPLMGRESRKYAEEKFDVRKVNAEMIRIMNI